MTESFIAAAKRLREQRNLRVVPDPPTDPFDAAEPADRFDTPTAGDGGYAQAALDRECEAVRTAPQGTRNNTLNIAAFNLGQLVAGGELTHAEVVTALTAAARQAGLDEKEIGPTINSGLSKGQLNPRQAPRDQILRGIYETPQQAAERWEEPEPLEPEDQPRTPFPVDVLPGDLRDYVQAVAANKQVPVDMVAQVVLAGLSTAALNRVWVEGAPGWVEPVMLWTLTAMESGSRKTSVMREVSRPFYTLERQARAEADRAAAATADRLAVATKQRDQLLSKASKAQSKQELDSIQADLDALRQEIDNLTPKPAPRWVVDDTTAEAIVSVMAGNQGYIGMFSAEGGILGTLSGRYTNGKVNFDSFLKAHDGEPIRVDRVTRDPLVVDQPALAMALAVQPDVLAETAKVPAMKERGFMGRFVYAVPEPTVGSRGVHAPPIPGHLPAAWERIVARIAALPVIAPDEVGPVIRPTRDALEHHRDFRQVLEPRMHPLTGDLAFMADFVSKLPGKVLRIAALLHLAAGHSTADPLGLDTMAAAVEIGDWALGHAAHVYGGWRAPEQSTGAIRLLEWIRRTRPMQFTVRDAWQALRGQAWCTQACDIKDAVVKLVEAGWLTSVERKRADGRHRLKEGLLIPHPTLLGGA